MDIYGATSKGTFILQQLDVLPVFTEYDIGRLLFIKDDGNYYLGGIDAWIKMTGVGLTRLVNLDIGETITQINANTLPIMNFLQNFNNNDTIEVVLNNLANGNYLQERCIKTIHYDLNSITVDKLSLGLDDSQIGSQTIPHYDSENKKQSTIKDQFDYILTTRQKSYNYLITTDLWQYDSVKDVFSYSFFYEPTFDLYPTIQLYDHNGNMFLPVKITVNKILKRITIVLDIKVETNVVVIG